ncbi:hypothetical protein [Streptomyces calidiresistens]
MVAVGLGGMLLGIALTGGPPGDRLLVAPQGADRVAVEPRTGTEGKGNPGHVERHGPRGHGTAVPARDAADTVEYRLAVLDHGEGLAPDDPIVPDYARALDCLEPMCVEDREGLGDAVTGALGVLAVEGTDSTAEEMLWALNRVVMDELAPMNCAELAAALVVLMSA